MAGSVLDTITAYLTGKGFTPAQVAGIEGNLQVESGLNPGAYNPNEGAIGLAQWEKGRRTNLQRFAAAHGGSEQDLYTQLDFMWSELQGPEHSALTALLGTSTPAEAATVWDQKYERSAGTSRQARIDAANNYASGVTMPGSGSSTKSSSGGGPSALGSLLIPGYGMLDVAAGSDGWAGQALAIGTKILLTGAAVALVIVGVVHTVKDEKG
jgi:hypothetical protein